MAKLILSMDGVVLKEIPLDRERLTIGRKPHNDLQIDNLAISGDHAAITTLLNDSFLEDLNSTNGTLVNGQPVRRHALRDNDLIELGKYRLKYVAESVAPAAPDFEKTMILRPGAVRPAPEAPAPRPEPPPPPAQPRPAAIQLLSGANAGRELDLSKSLTTLGKAGQQVAVIARRPHGYFITHVEGDRFPVLNGRTLDAQAHPLNDHDVIEIAGVKMEFFFRT